MSGIEPRLPNEILVSKAIAFGASGASVIPAASVVVEDRFRDLCSRSFCPGYGNSPSCPPHSMKPGEFRDLLMEFEYALVFRVDVPADVLIGDGKNEAAGVISVLASHLEEFLAGESVEAAGFATGSCRLILCGKYEDCPVITGAGNCRFPGKPRPSLSGLGVNFKELFREIGWELDVVTSETDSRIVPTGTLAGLVLFQRRSPV